MKNSARKAASVQRYLSLYPVTSGTLFRWLGVMVVFILVSESIAVLLGRPVVPDGAVATYQRASSIPLLWMTVTVIAPVLEELLFRGVLFESIGRSRCGPAAALLITAFAWALIHVQYGLFDRGVVFAAGLLLGTARMKTRSLYTTMAMHALANFVAISETALVVHFGSRYAWFT